MIKNEERLYHVVVSFPSICAKEFLILKFKRNEAICCLIGFGIGISCCLMYRWLKSYFFISNQEQSAKDDLWSFRRDCEEKYLETGSMLNATSSKCGSSPVVTATNLNIKYSKKNRTKAASRPDKTSFSMSKSNSNTSISTNNSCSCCCCLTKKQANNTAKFLQSQSEVNYICSNSFDHNEPLNDVYMNLTKFLNKQFCRNIKLRRPNVNSRTKPKNHLTKSLSQNTNITLTNSNNNLSSIYHSNEQNRYASNISSARSSVSPQPESVAPKRLTTNQSIDKFLNLKYEITPSGTVMNHNLEKTNNTATKQSYTHFSSLSSYLSEVNQLNNNSCGNNSDDLSFELFASSSHRSSLFDFDDNSDSKYANQKSDNLVDQSLDEALNQINKLKEDMNNLCEDIDSLYNTKSNVRLNYLDEKDEEEENFNDKNSNINDYYNNGLDSSNKCNCIYSECFIQSKSLVKQYRSFRNRISQRFGKKNRRNHVCHLVSNSHLKKKSRLL